MATTPPSNENQSFIIQFISSIGPWIVSTASAWKLIAHIFKYLEKKRQDEISEIVSEHPIVKKLEIAIDKLNEYLERQIERNAKLETQVADLAFKVQKMERANHGK